MKGIEKNSIEHGFFDYLPDLQRQETKNRVYAGKSKIVFFEEGGKEVFAAIFDVDEGDFLHIRECGGHFPRYHRKFFYFASTLAFFLGKKFLSLKTQIDAVAYLASKHGFKSDGVGNMVVKVV